MKVLLSSLPVPDIKPGFQRGNHQLFAGFVSAYAADRGMKGLTVESLPRPVVDRYTDRAITRELAEREPSIIGFSLYVWNRKRTLRIAGLCRDRGMTVIAGGPEAASLVTEGGRDELPFDLIIRGEGEDRLLELLSGSLQPGDPDLTANDTKILDSCPVDFTTFMETYCRNSKEHEYDGLEYLEIERGCPFSCAFCSYAKGRQTLVSLPFEIFTRCVDLLFQKPIDELYLLAPTLNRDRAVFRDRLRYLVRRQKSREKPVRLFGELRPELLDSEDLRLLHEAGFREIELGVQTLNPDSTFSGKRMQDSRLLDTAVKMLETGIEPILDFILGLPGDTIQTMMETIRTLDSRGLLPYSSFYRLQVLPGTRLHDDYTAHGWDFQKEPPYYTIDNGFSTETDIREVYRYLEEEKDHAYGEEMTPAVPGGMTVLEKPGDENLLLTHPFLHTATLVFTETYPLGLLADTFRCYFQENPEVFHRSYLFFRPHPEDGYDTAGIVRRVRELETVFTGFPNGYDEYRSSLADPILSKRIEVLLTASAPHEVVRGLIEEGLDTGFYADAETELSDCMSRLIRYREDWGLPLYKGKMLEEIQS